MTDETPWDKDLKKLWDCYPLTEEALCECLGISMLSAEGYYATLVYKWMMQRKPID